MKVSEFMTQPVITTTPSAGIEEVVRLMTANRISGLPVMDAGGAILGMITEADLLRRSETGADSPAAGWRTLFTGAARLAERYVRSHGRKVGEIMTHGAISIAPDEPLGEAAALMEARRVKRLPVLEHGRLVGIISRTDLLRALQQILPPGPSAAASDVAIRRAIWAELDRQRWVPPTFVDVKVDHGTVELRGIVLNDAERRALRVVAENIPGVKAVVDHLVWVEPYTGLTVEVPPEQTATPDRPPSPADKRPSRP